VSASIAWVCTAPSRALTILTRYASAPPKRAASSECSQAVLHPSYKPNAANATPICSTVTGSACWSSSRFTPGTLPAPARPGEPKRQTPHPHLWGSETRCSVLTCAPHVLAGRRG
jgi:hypothetical protein